MSWSPGLFMGTLRLLLTVFAFAMYFIGMVAFSAVTTGAIHSWFSPHTVRWWRAFFYTTTRDLYFNTFAKPERCRAASKAVR
jgi:hypothetical protein